MEDNKLLREFIKESVVSEVKLDVDDVYMSKLMAYLRGEQGLKLSSDVRSVAYDWINDVEALTGAALVPWKKGAVTRFVGSKWPGLLDRFRGNVQAARYTMFNMLDAKFKALKYR